MRVTDEEKQVVEAASRTIPLLRRLNVPLVSDGGAFRYVGKLGSIAVAALKRLKVMQEEIDGAVKGGIA